jgi:hypothetical protein
MALARFFSPLFLGSVFISCTGALITESRETSHLIDRVNLTGVRFFRPNYEVAEWDDFSHKDRELVCSAPAIFWESILNHAVEVNECLSQLKGEVVYRFIKKDLMELELETEGKSTECLSKWMAVIPLPREIYFMGTEAKLGERLSVYSVSFNPRTNNVLDLPFLAPRPKIRLRFPLSRRFLNRADLEIWLETLLFSLFHGESGMHASYVPEFTAKQCFRSDSLYFEKISGRLPPVFWP